MESTVVPISASHLQHFRGKDIRDWGRVEIFKDLAPNKFVLIGH